MRLLLLLIFSLKLIPAVCGQEGKTADFRDSIRNYDLSTFWRADSVLYLKYVDNTFLSGFQSAEPIGFIGSNYQRFYIHIISVRQDERDSRKYKVTGKTMVKDNISRFYGTITIDSARYFVDSIVPKFKRGYVICHCVFHEDKNKGSSGCIVGKLQTDWCIYRHHIYYDNTEGDADDYCNNQFEGKWTSYKRRTVMKCNWGNERIPDCGDLDEGASEFFVNPKYVVHGWQNYENAYHEYSDSLKAKKALTKENEQWWK